MLRGLLGLVCGATVAWAALSTQAMAQRPAAWDTRVRNPAPVVPEPHDAGTAPKPKSKEKKSGGPAGDRKAGKTKPDTTKLD